MPKCHSCLVYSGSDGVPVNCLFIWQPARTRYCRRCNAYTDHFDHHCPAIKNCVGKSWAILVKVIEFYNVGASKASKYQLLFDYYSNWDLRSVEMAWLLGSEEI